MYKNLKFIKSIFVNTSKNTPNNTPNNTPKNTPNNTPVNTPVNTLYRHINSYTGHTTKEMCIKAGCVDK